MSFKSLFLSGVLAASVVAAGTLCPPAAFAQTSGVGNISGNVTDSTGAAVAGATVTIINTGTGATRTVTTNNQGGYVASFLQPGSYEVIAGGGSFGKVDRKDLQLTVGQTLSIDAQLPAASVATAVEVTSTQPILDTEKTEVSQTIGQRLISNLPVSSRNWSSFVLLTPNAVPDGGSGMVAFHGISGLYNQNYVDGANNNQMLFAEARGRASGAPYVYSLDSIKEFQAETSNYSVEFGQAAGGQVNAITKSGTNSMHGDLFYYLRYPDLNALDPQSKWSALHNNGNPFLLTQPTHQQQQFGGSIGGPIFKDKLFYFFTYDGFRKVGRVLYYTTSNVTLTPITTTATNVITPTQCPTTISSAQCTAAVTFIQQLAGVGVAPPTRFQKQNLFFPRLDYQINNANHVFVNYNFVNFDSTNGYAGNPTYSNSSASTNGPTSYHERFLVANWTSVISAHSVNEVRFQWGRDLETAGANAAPPSVTLGSSSSTLEAFGMPNALPRAAEPDEHRFQFTDVFNYNHGRHSFKFGGDANIVHEVMINLYQGGGLYSYSGTQLQAFQSWAKDAFVGQPGDTDPLAGKNYTTFVQTIDQINTPAMAGADDFWMKMYDGFAEDSWKIRPNLTLNIGVRYDLQLTPNPAQPNTSSALAAKYNSTIKNVDTRIQPRIGFSWSPVPSMVVRGGYGLFSGLNQGSTYYAMRVENGVYQINYNANGGSAATLTYPNIIYSAPASAPPLASALTPTGGTKPTAICPLPTEAGGGTCAFAASTTQSFHGLSPDFVPPLVHEVNLAVEQSLPGKMSLSVGYVGSRATRLPVFLDANLVGQKASSLQSYQVTDAKGITSLLTVPFYKTTDRIIPTLGAINSGFSIANSWYHSLATTLRRPFSNGLEMIVNYTWSKALDDDQVAGTYGTFYGGNPVVDPNNLKAEHGPADIDARHRMTANIVYQPMIFSSNKIVKYALDQFVFSGTYTVQSGLPIVAGLSGYPSGGADGGLTGGTMSSGSGAGTAGRPVQIGRNSQFGPGVQNMDLRVSRDFAIREGMKFQLIGEAFNLANHKIVTGVNSTYSNFAAAGATGCPTVAAAPGATFGGCLTPNNTGTSAFGTPSSTGSVIYGPRQLQIAAKFLF